MSRVKSRIVQRPGSRVRSRVVQRPKRARFSLDLLFRFIYNTRYIFSCAFFVMAVGYLTWSEQTPLILASITQQFQTSSKKIGFRIDSVGIDGLEQTKREDILKAIGLQEKQPVFQLNLQQARQEIESLPWVHTAMIFRRLPNHIHIRISERHPNALWQKDKQIYLIDEHGKVIEHVKKVRDSKLLLVIGDQAPQQAHTIIQTLKKFPELSKKITSATNHGGRRWDLTLHNHVKIKLPEDDIEQALMHLEQLDKDHDLTQGDIRVIDIRLKDRSFFYMEPGAKKAKFNAQGRQAT